MQGFDLTGGGDGSVPPGDAPRVFTVTTRYVDKGCDVKPCRNPTGLPGHIDRLRSVTSEPPALVCEGPVPCQAYFGPGPGLLRQLAGAAARATNTSQMFSTHLDIQPAGAGSPSTLFVLSQCEQGANLTGSGVGYNWAQRAHA
jgi:hypothetical protein